MIKLCRNCECNIICHKTSKMKKYCRKRNYENKKHNNKSQTNIVAGKEVYDILTKYFNKTGD